MRFEGRRGFPRRRGILAVLGISLMAFSAGCGIKLGDHPDDQSSYEIGDQTDCLSGAADKIGKYLHGQSTQGEIGGLWDCAKSSLQLFENETQGQVAGQWQPQELKKFLERYFLRDFRISDGLMTQAMLLKQTLLGGSQDMLTRDDLDRAQALMDQLKTTSLAIQPYIPLLNPDRITSLSQSDLEEAITALQNGASDLGRILQEEASPYSFSDFDSLLFEVESFMSDSDYESGIVDLRQNLPFFQQLKKIFVSSGSESDAIQMTGADWRNLLTTGARAYSIYLHTVYATKNDTTFVWGQGLEDVFKVASDTKTLLDDIIVRNGGQVSFKNIDELIDTQDVPGLVGGDSEGMKYFSLLGDRICRQHLKDFLRVITRRFLTEPMGAEQSDLPPMNGAMTEAMSESLPLSAPVDSSSCIYPGPPTTDTDGIKKEHLERFWSYLLEFVNGQRYLQADFTAESQSVNGDASGFAEASIAPETLAIPSLESLFSQDTLNQNPALRQAGDQLRAYLGETDLFPLFKKDEFRIAFNGYRGDRTESLWSLSYMNGIGSVVRMVLSSYIPHQTVGAPGSGADKAQREKELAVGASRSNLEQFYRDTKNIGIDVDLYDPTSVNSADRRQLEASLFTFHAVGGDHMPMEEGTDYVSTLISAVGLAAHVYDRVFDECRSDGVAQCMKSCTLGTPNACQTWCDAHNTTVGPKDVFGSSSIAVDCFHRKFYGEFASDVWDHMPALYDYFTSLPHRPVKNPKGTGNMDPIVYQDTVACFMDQVARGCEEGLDWYDSGDIQELAALSHYIEALYTRFDQNGDGFIDFDEGMKVFAILDPILISAQQSAAPGSPMAALSSENRRLAALTYMLKTGNIPTELDFIKWEIDDYADFNDWFNHQNHDAWHYMADRGRALQIMGMITAMASPGGFNPCAQGPIPKTAGAAQSNVVKAGASPPGASSDVSSTIDTTACFRY